MSKIIEPGEYIKAWYSIDQLFLDEKSGALTEALSDESGSTLIIHVFNALEDSIDWTDEDLLERGRVFFSLLSGLSQQLVDELDSDNPKKTLLLGVARLIQHRPELRRSFTRKECESFIEAMLENETSKLNILDQFTGFYLMLKVFEEFDPKNKIDLQLVQYMISELESSLEN